jgi:hypothetical protein
MSDWIDFQDGTTPLPTSGLRLAEMCGLRERLCAFEDA